MSANGSSIQPVAVMTLIILVLSTLLSPGSEPALESPYKAGPGWDFRTDVLPVLASSGCSSAECHGSATGRGGFRLSLFGTDPLADYDSITRGSFGRRIDLRNPAQSLVLLKPTRQIPHEGGEIFREDSTQHAHLLTWIRDGAPWRSGPEKSIRSVTLEMTPSHRLRLTGEFSVGGEGPQFFDVSVMAAFSSTAPAVASVDATGLVSVNGPGEAYLIGRFAGLTHRIAFREPFGPAGLAGTDAGAPGNFVQSSPMDAIWAECLNRTGLSIPSRAEAWRVARRLYLSVAGRPPFPEELDVFHQLVRNAEADADTDPLDSAVADAIERALSSPSYDTRWGHWAAEWLEVKVTPERPDSGAMGRLESMLSERVARDGSLLDLASEVLGANRDFSYLKRYADPRDRSEFVGRALLGVRIGCARCHNHPDDRWTRMDHLGFSAAFSNFDLEQQGSYQSSFSKTPVLDIGKTPSNYPGMMAGMQSGNFKTDGDRLYLPGTGHAVEPVLLSFEEGNKGLKSIPAAGAHDSSLAGWLRNDARLQFSRNIANRIFGHLTGFFPVSPEDDHRSSNPALYEPLLDHLAREFEKSGFRLKPFIRYVAASRLFQMGGADEEEGSLPSMHSYQYLAAWQPVPLDVFAWTQSLSSVLGVPLPPLETQENPLSMQLSLLNSGWIERILRIPGNQFEALGLFTADSDRQRLVELYRMLFSVELDDALAAALLETVSGGSAKPLTGDQWEQLFKALVLSPEFCFVR